MKLCTIVGARPQFIKAATVSRIIAETPGLQEMIVHTGQHYDANMSSQFFDELSIPEPTHHLSIGSGSHGKQTGQMLSAIEEVLLQEKPDVVLVYGDTNSTLAGALAAVKLHIPVAHVEAGLRSFNRRMPEEINRITADHLSDVLFAPTDNGYQQLLKEGIAAEKTHNVGDVMYDATLFYNEYNANRETMVDKLQLRGKPYVLATIHRAENTDSETRLKHICDALYELSQACPVILPLHPRTRTVLSKSGYLATFAKQVHLIDPVGYLDMLALEKEASCIVTDSGGVQKEAYFNQVPCITLRDETEWVELVEAGWNRLCSPEQPFSLKSIIDEKDGFRKQHGMLYGDGQAARKIVDVLCRIK
ncbi:non-hydrolyzing UDP-N-acetylglucosamine 2-epimerase [Legionella spiritensis]|uniref:UDP-N-acetylglucosamine 2-epimerase n=1 Tax=Legionella spiritensis TaxID=452 RepID=A0A0W0YYU9_LEGSP|nr:UDP-N-acetylglucosamine 2-epimerase (non-hydrolyzing) [Legionella spiritensis]KTD62018.1 UDP-N-acetylglucosamine 2-epimerase [Legionella spiritensis]SNV34731.1 UDP-N-acetylglucosamine 2-epimerase [Legionella spiritensis]